MIMTIPDEAVQAAMDAFLNTATTKDGVHAALAAALPFLQGVNDAWANTDNAPKDGTRLILLWKPFGGISEHIELGRWSSDKGVWVNTYGHAFSSPPDAWTPLAPYKAPSPRDYRDCVCTKIHQDEDCLIGYPSLLCEICDGKGVVPSPRAQSLEEALRNLLHAVCGETGFANAVRQVSRLPWPWPSLDIAEAAAIRALSSQPVADGWLPMDHPDLPDDGTTVILATTGGHVGEAVPPDTQDDDDDWYWCGAACRINKNHKPIAWRPLPASPGASE